MARPSQHKSSHGHDQQVNKEKKMRRPSQWEKKNERSPKEASRPKWRSPPRWRDERDWFMKGLWTSPFSLLVHHGLMDQRLPLLPFHLLTSRVTLVICQGPKAYIKPPHGHVTIESHLNKSQGEGTRASSPIREALGSDPRSPICLELTLRKGIWEWNERSPI